MPHSPVAIRLPPDLQFDDPTDYIGLFAIPVEMTMPPLVVCPLIECLLCGELGGIVEVLWEQTEGAQKEKTRIRIGRCVGVDMERGAALIDTVPDGMRVYGCGNCGQTLYYPRGGGGYAP